MLAETPFSLLIFSENHHAAYLPWRPSVGDRIFQTIRASGVTTDGDLSIVSAEPQLWDGCLGVSEEDEVCAAIGILGWRAIAADTQSTWVYHTDGLGNRIVLKKAEQALFK